MVSEKSLQVSKTKNQSAIRANKRILKRIYHESVDGQSGYSSVMSSYVDISNEESDKSLEQIPEMIEDPPEDNKKIGNSIIYVKCKIIYHNDI